MKWHADGELTALDFNLVMQRLAQVDPQVMTLHESTTTSARVLSTRPSYRASSAWGSILQSDAGTATQVST
jgi:hypothetical protein